MARRPTSDPAGMRRLKASFVLLVGVSGALVAVQGESSPLVVVLSLVGGLLAGAALVWYLSRIEI